MSQKLDREGDITWKISKTLIGKLKASVPKSSCTLSNEQRCEILDNGNLRIDRLKKHDEATYSVEMHNSAGEEQMKKQFILVVLEPISVPNVSFKCAEEKIDLTCKVEQRGSVNISLFLKDVLLRNQAESPIKETIPISNSGSSFKCVTRNEISEKNTQMIINCPSELSWILILSIAGGSILLIIFLSLLIFCLRRRTQPKSIPAAEEVELSIMKPVPRRSHRQLSEPPRKLPEPPRKLPEPPRKLPQPPVEHPDQPQLQKEKQQKPRRQKKQHEQQPPIQKLQLPQHRPGPQQQQEPRPRPRTQQKSFDYYVEER